MKKEEVKVKVNAEEPKNKKEEPAKQEAEKAKKKKDRVFQMWLRM